MLSAKLVSSHPTSGSAIYCITNGNPHRLFRSQPNLRTLHLRPNMDTFTSFDGTRIAYHDEGNGPAVILLHGFGVDALGRFGEFERLLPGLQKRQAMFREAF